MEFILLVFKLITLEINPRLTDIKDFFKPYFSLQTLIEKRLQPFPTLLPY